MIKNFNSVPMLKSSEVCNKFSKSVSYETLVGGTTTICTDIKQTQRLSESSADKPLDAVGTLTSLLCNSAKVMEKLLRHVITRRTSVRRGYLPEKCTHANEESLFASVTWLMRLPRRIQRMLLVMTIPVSCREVHKRRFIFNSWILRFANAQLRMTIPMIVFLLNLNISTAWAISCPDGTLGSNDINDNISCGTNCCWGIDKNTHVLTITPALDNNGNSLKNVRMKNYDFSENNNNVDALNGYTSELKSTAPWAREDIVSVVVDEGIERIGDFSFIGETKIKNINGMNDVEIIGRHAFQAASALERIYMPNVKSIEYGAFAGTYSLTSVDMPNVENIGGHNFYNNLIKYIGFPIDKDVVIGDNNGSISSLCSNKNRSACGSCGNGYVMSGVGCVFDCGDGYLGKDGRCIDASLGCGAGYRQFENFCNKILWTPAEAAEVLRDDNNNSVTITFKK